MPIHDNKYNVPRFCAHVDGTANGSLRCVSGRFLALSVGVVYFPGISQGSVFRCITISACHNRWRYDNLPKQCSDMQCYVSRWSIFRGFLVQHIYIYIYIHQCGRMASYFSKLRYSNAITRSVI